MIGGRRCTNGRSMATKSSTTQSQSFYLTMLFVFLWIIVSLSCHTNYFTNAFSFFGKGQRTNNNHLGKKSTALDVYEYLNSTNQLASYVDVNNNNNNDRDGSTTKDVRRGVAVVTGGSSGIGVVTVQTLAQLAGMKVIVCARNITKAKDVIIKNFDPSTQQNIVVIEMDLNHLNSVKQAVEEILLTYNKIDVLINNAGVMALPKRQYTKQHIEQQMGINHVAHHYLTTQLLPYMQNGGRVVTVASRAHKRAGHDMTFLDDLNSTKHYSPWKTYGRTKLANILFAKELQDQFDFTQKKILTVSLHPGVIKTNLWNHITNGNKVLDFFSNFVADKTLEQGAATTIFCSLVSSDHLVGGGYYQDCSLMEPNRYGNDKTKTLRKLLWTNTEQLLTNVGFPTTTTTASFCTGSSNVNSSSVMGVTSRVTTPTTYID